MPEGREPINKRENKEDYDQEEIEDVHDVDVNVEHLRFDHVNGTKSSIVMFPASWRSKSSLSLLSSGSAKRIR